jgi:putative membrane protein insertion efficiency factor
MPADDAGPVGLAARIVLALIRGYQLLFSPIFGGSCRYVPSCSAYAAEAVHMHGAARGTILAVRRLARCQPFGGHGYDPVPRRN